MQVQSVETEFSECWSKLTVVEKQSLLSVARNYIHLKEDFAPVSIEQYNKEIDEAMRDMDNGDFYAHEHVVQMSKNWLNGK